MTHKTNPTAGGRRARNADLVGTVIEFQDIQAHTSLQVKHIRDGNAEARGQAAIVEWVRTVAPNVICFHPANGGLRSKPEAARLKWTGVFAGIPDLVIVGKDGRVWFIEVKSERGSLSGEQRAMRDHLIAMRIPYVVARSIDDVRQAFALWGIQTREAGR